jgi:Ca2+:H+ antiporter
VLVAGDDEDVSSLGERPLPSKLVLHLMAGALFSLLGPNIATTSRATRFINRPAASTESNFQFRKQKDAGRFFVSSRLLAQMPSDQHSSESTPLLHQILPSHIHPDGESGRSGFHPSHFLQVAWKSGSNAAKYANLLWPLVPVAIILRYVATGSPLAIFATSYIAMVPVANLLGFAGQEFARKMPKVSGILIETAFGSIVEIILFMILIAKHTSEHGASEEGNLVPVIQAAILGSIITNLLLCLGLCFFVGGLRQASQKFHASISEVGSGLLLVAGFGLLIPSAYYSALKGSAVAKSAKHHDFTEKVLQHNVLRISQITSILLIIAFCM